MMSEASVTALQYAAEPAPEEKVAALLTVLDISCRLAAVSDLLPMLEGIAAAAREVLDCEWSSVFLYDENSHELYSLVVTGVEGIRFSADMGIAGEAFRTGGIINVPDAYADPRFNREIDLKTGSRTRNLLTCPLVGWDKRTLGVYQVLNKRDGCFRAWDEVLARAFSALAGVAVQRQLLLEEVKQKQRFERDLEVARDIQQRLFPKEAPELPGFDIAGWSLPADQTGGDFYDFKRLTSGNLAVILADVSGHGIGPALVVSECRALIRATLAQTEQLDQLAVSVNQLLCEDIPDNRFVTVFFGLLLPEAAQFRYLSAGHGPVLVYRAATDEIQELPVHGCPLGFAPELVYDPPGEFTFAQGDILVILTDGFLEWPDLRNERYGLERLCRCLHRYHELPATKIIRSIYQSVLSFSGGSPQNDDLSAVVIKRV